MKKGLTLSLFIACTHIIYNKTDIHIAFSHQTLCLNIKLYYEQFLL